MSPKTLGCVMVLALTSCVAEVGAPEEVGESPEAMVATIPSTVVQPGAIPPFRPEAPKPDLSWVPKWKAYIATPKGHPLRYGARPDRPDLVDEDGYVVLVRPPDGGPEQCIPLFLRQAWRYGDLYFERLGSQMGLTPADWLGILVALAELEQHPKTLPHGYHLAPLVGPVFEEGGGSVPIPPPPPLPGDDHQGPGSTAGGGPVRGGTGPIPPRPPPPRPDYTSPPPLPPAPPGWEDFVAQHGVWPSELPPADQWPDDWPPTRPEDASYTPKHGEVKEVIRCEGKIVSAYKSNCIDFEPKTPGGKWMTKIGTWIQEGAGSAWDSLRARIHHDVWYDGKNPGCSEAAHAWARDLCVSEGITLFGACAAFPPCWGVVLPTTAGVRLFWQEVVLRSGLLGSNCA